MQDRFKFRVWNKENKCLSYPTRYSNFAIVNGTVVKIESYPTANSAYLGKRIAWEFDDAVIMQCTGKKDTNGKLIYEDDILELKAKNGMTFQYVVKFKDYCFILEYINGKLKGTKARNFAKQYAQPQRMYEHGYMVIGNIYENKELLND